MANRPIQMVGNYRIIRSSYIDDFETEVQEAVAEGWQPLNKQGFSSDDSFDYLMEMVKFMDIDEYREMVHDIYQDAGEPRDDSDTLRVAADNHRQTMIEALSRLQTVDMTGDSPDPDPFFDDELFNNE